MLKFSLCIQNNNIDGEITYAINGAELNNSHQKIFSHEGLHDPKGITNIEIKLLSNKGIQSHLLVKDVKVGDTYLNNMQNWSSYVLADGKIMPYTNGWLSFPGTFRLKLKYSPLVQNYVSYFYSLSKKV